MVKIKDLPEEQRPREKLIKFGPESLSDNELLAILIGSGTKGKSAIEIATNLLDEYKTIKGLAGRRLDEFMKINITFRDMINCKIFLYSSQINQGEINFIAKAMF